MIELGELGPPGTDPDAGPPPDPDRRLIRRWGVAVAAALCLLAVTGSVRPEPRGLRALWSVQMGEAFGTTLTADTVYLHQTVDAEPLLSAYDLASGALRWSRRVSGSTGSLQTAGPGLLLLPTDRRVVSLGLGDQDTWRTDFAQTTTALDPATGRTLWIVPGDVDTLGDDTALMAEHAGDGRLSRLRLLRLSDQHTIWSREVPGVQSRTIAVSAGGRPDRIITATDRGEISVFRYADGVGVASARIRWVPPDPEHGVFTDLFAIGGALVVSRVGSDVVDLRVYRLDTMAEAWTRTGPGDYPFSCGPAICLHDRFGVTSLEPLTGRIRWRLPTADQAWAITPDRLILDSDGEGRSVLVDTATGALVGEQGAGSPVWSSEPGPEILLLAPTVSPPDRTSVTRWELATGRRNLLGVIPRLAEPNCQAVPGYLTCVRSDVLDVTAVG